jgi:hypothetical protein
MPSALDITGQTYGRLTAIERSGRVWLCRCACGNLTMASAGKLRYGHKSSCGCAKRESGAKNGRRAIKDRAGQRYGLLVAEKYIGRGSSNGARWLVRCDCGRTLEMNASNLERSKSCGCRVPAIAAEVCRGNFAQRWAANRHRRGEAAARSLYAAYRNRTRNKRLGFSISFQEFSELTARPCHYCGDPPSNKWARSNRNRLNGDYVYNGIDRVDNALGYIRGNVVPCCRQCNSAKNTLALARFDQWIQKVNLRMEVRLAERAS